MAQRAKNGECPTKNEFIALLDNSLGQLEAAQIEEHLANCEGCEQVFQSILLEERQGWETWRDLHVQDKTRSQQLPTSVESHDLFLRYLHGQGFDEVEEIGRGGMGVVYRAREIALDRRVAIKVLLHGPLAGRERVQRLNTEAQAIAKLNHPAIVQIHGLGQYRETPYLLLEYVEGKDLAGRLADGPIEEVQAARICLALADALSHAHSNSVVHRDIKPSNILFSGNSPMLADFGLAKATDSDADLTHTGTIMGTPAYMSPEQAANDNSAITEASDVYSLGVVLYEMLCGFPPFRSSNTAESLRMVCEQEPIPARRLQPKLSRDINTICLKCLQKNPSQRYHSADDLKEDLDHLLNGRPIVARPISPLSYLTKWAKRSPLAASLASVSIMVTVAMILIWANFTWQLKQQRDAVARETAFANENFERAHKAIREYLVSFRSHTPLGSSKSLAFQEETIGNGLGFYESLLENSSQVENFRAAPDELAQAQLEYGELQFEFGKVMLVANRHSESIEAFETAIEVCGNLEEAKSRLAPQAMQICGSSWTSMVTPLRKLGRHEQALEAANESLASYKASRASKAHSEEYANWYESIAWQRIGQCLVALDRVDDAQEAFEKAHSLASLLSDVSDFQLTLARIKLDLGRLERSCGHFGLSIRLCVEAIDGLRIVRLNNRFPRYDEALGSAYEELGITLRERDVSSGRQIGVDSCEAICRAVEEFDALCAAYPNVEQYAEDRLQIIRSCRDAALPAFYERHFERLLEELEVKVLDAEDRDNSDWLRLLANAETALLRGQFEGCLERCNKCRETVNPNEIDGSSNASLNELTVQEKVGWSRLHAIEAEACFALGRFFEVLKKLAIVQEVNGKLSQAQWTMKSFAALQIKSALESGAASKQRNAHDLVRTLPSPNAYVAFDLLHGGFTGDADGARLESFAKELASSPPVSMLQRAQHLRALLYLNLNADEHSDVLSQQIQKLLAVDSAELAILERTVKADANLAGSWPK